MKLMKMSRRARTILISIAAPLLLIVGFAVVIFIYMNFHQPPTVDMTATGFAPQSVEITEGETIQFVNQSPTVSQVLCVGTNQHCDPSALDPRSLASPGVRFAPGQSKAILFDTPGTYTITSTVVPKMNLTITVDEAI
jgi:plastocyanin